MAAKQPEAPVTVVLLNYNGGEMVRRCIRSLAAQTAAPARVLFVDNGSSTYDEGALRADFGVAYAERLAFARIEVNVGYVGGMNRGLRQVIASPLSPPWVMTLSNDTELDPRFFERLGAALAGLDARVGMLCPKIRSLQAPDTLDATGIGVCLDGMSTAIGQRERDGGQYDSDRWLLAPSGVSSIFGTNVLRDVGLLDERFWAYCEDTDLGLRAWLAGWEGRYVPECVLYHARSSTLGEHSLNKLYLVERNHFWVALKNLPLPLLLINPFLSAYRYLLQAYAILSRKGLGGRYGGQHSVARLAATTLRGILHAARGAPAVFVQRLRGRRLRRRPAGEVLVTFWRRRLPFGKLILK